MDYFRRPISSPTNRPLSRQASNINGQWTANTPSETPRTPYFDGDGSQTLQRPPPPMRIRRLPSTPDTLQSVYASSGRENQTRAHARTLGAQGRPRSSSAPQRPRSASAVELEELRGGPKINVQLDTLAEEGPSGTDTRLHDTDDTQSTRQRKASDAANSAAEWVLGRKRRSTSTSRHAQTSQDYEDDVVDLLDVIDPEVSTLSMLNNVQNSLFIPPLGRFLRRQPTYDLSKNLPPLSRIPTANERLEAQSQKDDLEVSASGAEPSIFGAPLSHSHSISSVLSESNFAVLPHGLVLEGWSEADKAELDDHVRHLLHSRKAGFKRSMRAFGKYVRTRESTRDATLSTTFELISATALGFFVTTYAFLVTFWGTAWVLFIIGWLSAGDRQAYFIEICDQVLTALFCVIGIGMAPFRAVDTYHMIYIAKYHYKTLRLRREKQLPPLPDENDLPEPPKKDEETGLSQEDQDELLLTPAEQGKFEYHRLKFCKSHTFYKPHETYTHHAFGIDLLITAVTLLDFHSIFQMALGGTTWGINYHHRPKALTAVILACSISCNISAGLVISIGGKKTRKKDVVERLFRQALTEEALRKLEKKKGLKPTANEDAVANVVNQQHAEAYEQLAAQEVSNIGMMARP